MGTSYFTVTFNDGGTNTALALFGELDDAVMFARMKTRGRAGDGRYGVYRVEDGEVTKSYCLG